MGESEALHTRQISGNMAGYKMALTARRSEILLWWSARGT